MAKQKQQETVLSAEQVKVIEHMVEGETVAESAKLAGVQLVDVESWLQNDAAFVAGLNARQQDNYRANVDRLRSLAGQAIDTLSELLQSDTESIRLKAATAVLRSVNLVQVKEPAGSTTATKVEKEWARERAFDYW